MSDGSSSAKKIPFDKLTPKERHRLFNELKDKMSPVLGSRKGSPVLRFNFVSLQLQPAPRLFVEAPSESLAKENTYTVNFGLDSGVYFFSSNLLAEQNQLFFDLSGPIFKIQRRKNFRCPLPSGTFSQVAVRNDSNGPPLRGAFNLRDLSGGGCSLFLPSTESINSWPSGKTYVLDLKIGDLKYQGLNAVIRHEESSEPQAWVGFEFLNLTMAQESELSALVLELQRTWFEIYARQED